MTRAGRNVAGFWVFLAVLAVLLSAVAPHEEVPARPEQTPPPKPIFQAAPKKPVVEAVAEVILPPPPEPETEAPTQASLTQPSPPRPPAPAQSPDPRPVPARLIKPLTPSKHAQAPRKLLKVMSMKVPSNPASKPKAAAVERKIKPLKPTPRPKPVVRPEPGKTVQPGPDAQEPPRPVPTPAKSAEVPRPEQTVKEAVKTGRVLLRLLEHGSGPAIEIAWPEDRRQREYLYRLFEGCLDMRVAYMTREGALYVSSGPMGRPWAPNVDRYSGFLRQPSGPATAKEAQAMGEIGRHHGRLPEGAPVRLFSRRADALLIGGLSGIVGDAYTGAKVIAARYDLNRGGLAVTGVRVDGKPIPGRVDLSSLISSVCFKGA